MDSITATHSSKHHVNKFIASTLKSESIAVTTDHRVISVDIDLVSSSSSSTSCKESPQIWSCSQQLISPFDCNNNNSNPQDTADQATHNPWQQSNGLSAKVYPLICLNPQDRKFLCKTYPINRGHRLSLGSGFKRSCKVMPHHAALRRAESSADSAIMLDNVFEEVAVDVHENICHFKDDIFDDFQDILLEFVCLVLENRDCYSFTSGKIMTILNRYYNLGSLDEIRKTNKFGFVYPSTPSPSPASSCMSTPTSSPGSTCSSMSFFDERDERRLYLEQVASEVLNTRCTKYWLNCTVTEDNLKHMIREYGIPNDMRPHLWSKFIHSRLNPGQHDARKLLRMSDQTISTTDINENSTMRQIELDLYRTMPNHEMFESTIGIEKLRRILIAYCVHVNPVNGYCQAMNFIAALLLIVFHGNEAESLNGLICIIDHYFPSQYFDHQLTGVRADQLLLRDLLLDRLKIKRSGRESRHGAHQIIDEITNSLTINWFLSLFHSALPFQARLHVLDCFFTEGIKVLFRFSLALIDLGKDSLTHVLNLENDRSHPHQQASSSLPTSTTSSSCSSPHTFEFSSGDVINKIKMMSRNCFNVIQLKKVAFQEVQMPRRRVMAARRSFYVKQLKSKNREPETAYQWIKRRSRELIIPSPGSFTGKGDLLLSNRLNLDSLRIIMSEDCSKIAVLNQKDDSVEIFDTSVQDFPMKRISLKFLTGDLDSKPHISGSSLVLSRVNSSGNQLIFLTGDCCISQDDSINYDNCVIKGSRRQKGSPCDTFTGMQSFRLPCDQQDGRGDREHDDPDDGNQEDAGDEIMCHVIRYPWPIFKSFHRESVNEFIIISEHGLVTRFHLPGNMDDGEDDQISRGREPPAESIQLIKSDIISRNNSLRSRRSGSVVAAAIHPSSSALLICFSSSSPSSVTSSSPASLLQPSQTHQPLQRQTAAVITADMLMMTTTTARKTSSSPGSCSLPETVSSPEGTYSLCDKIRREQQEQGIGDGVEEGADGHHLSSCSRHVFPASPAAASTAACKKLQRKASLPDSPYSSTSSSSCSSTIPCCLSTHDPSFDQLFVLDLESLDVYDQIQLCLNCCT